MSNTSSLLTGLLLSITTGCALAQTFPSKPIRFLVGYAPGGPNDTQARLIGARMSESIGQPVLVENKPGADGVIAGEMVVKAPADGHTMVLVSAGHSINPNFNKKLPYHPVRDFSPIAQVASAPFFLVVHPSVPAKSTQEFIDYARSRPGSLNYGSSGLGSSLMMAMELFNGMAGIKLNQVPYKGGAPATADLVAGRIQAMMNNAVSSLPNHRSGKLRALAVTTAERSTLAPDLPTIAETVPGYEVDAWYGMLTTKGVPPAVLKRLNAEVNRALESDALKQQYAKLGLTPVGGSPERFGKLLQVEVAKWAKVVKDSGIKTD